MKIIAYKKININEYLIKLQNHSEIKLYDDTIIKFDLLLLKEIDENKLKEIIDYNNTLSAYFLAIKYLTKKQRCKKETSDYLIKKEFSKNTIELVIKRLEKDLEVFSPYQNKYPDGKIICSLICSYTNHAAWTLYIGNDSLGTHTAAVNRCYYEALKEYLEN